jgi:hypothetical protein
MVSVVETPPDPDLLKNQLTSARIAPILLEKQ